MRTALPAFPWPLAVAAWDAAAVAIVVLFAIRGSSRGLVGGAVRAAGFVAALILASRLDRPMGALLLRLGWVAKESSDSIGWAVVVALVAFGSVLLASLLRAVVHETPLQPLDRALGAALGAVFGVGLCAVAVLAWAGTRPREEVRAALQGSATVVVVDGVMRLAGPGIPEALRVRWYEATGSPPP